MSFLLLFLVAIYIRAIRGSFRSSLDTFSPQSLDKLWSFLSKSFTPNDELRGIDVEMLNESQKNTRIANLQFSVLYNRLCYFLADKLITLRQGQVLAAIAGIKILWLFAATLVVFSLLNLGIYKIEPTQFTVIGSIRWFDFLWYTFQASFINNVSEIAPIGIVARSLFMANGITSGLILFIIVAFFVTSVQTTRNSDQIYTLASKIQAQGKEVEIFVVDVFGLTLTAAIEELIHVRAIFADWIVQISPETEPNLAKLDNHTGQEESKNGGENQG
ncbi:MAG: hypothetical protein H6657_06455 [Ardenticatenaceae bacterium]|nr:hypothetical protein [Ardenticatenaceae bacterium]